MVADAPGSAHAACGNNDSARANLVERFGFLDAGRELQIGQVGSNPMPASQFCCLLVEQFQMLTRDPRGFCGHGRVHKNHQVMQSSLTSQPV